MMDNSNKLVVRKYTLRKVNDTFWAPSTTIVLSAGHQDNKLVVWYLRPVENEDTVPFDVFAKNTGEADFEEDFGIYLDTVQIDTVVWHVFYIKGK